MIQRALVTSERCSPLRNMRVRALKASRVKRVGTESWESALRDPYAADPHDCRCTETQFNLLAAYAPTTDGFGERRRKGDAV